MYSTKLAHFLLAGLAACGFAIAQSPNNGAPPVPSRPASGASQPGAPASVSASPGDAMEGMATIYSDRLNGRKTASGQVFRQSELTAAHPSLPFDTKVKVTNLKNNKSVVVRINDRGPVHAGRVIDLASAAAAEIGMGKTGTASVKLEVVGRRPAK